MGYRRDIKVTVSEHAKERLLERFPGEIKPARIVDEVRSALSQGRSSIHKPAGLAPPDDPGTIYAWTPDGLRVYALKPDAYADGQQWAVTTTMRAFADEEAAAA